MCLILKPHSKSQSLKLLLVSDVPCFILKFMLSTYLSFFLTGRMLTIYNILKYLSCIKIAYNNNNNNHHHHHHHHHREWKMFFVDQPWWTTYNDTHMEEFVLYWITKIHWSTRLAVSDVFHMFTHQLGFFNFVIVKLDSETWLKLSEKLDSSNRQ